MPCPLCGRKKVIEMNVRTIELPWGKAIAILANPLLCGLPLPGPTVIAAPADETRLTETLAWLESAITPALAGVRDVLAFCGATERVPLPGSHSPQGWLLWAGTPDAAHVVPCPSMPNHGTWIDLYGRSWIITAPKLGAEWDDASDGRHEWAHAWFAPVPPFAQLSGAKALTRLCGVNGSELDFEAVAALLYFACEAIVCGLVTESRETETGLPVAETPHVLRAALTAWHGLLPGAGFDRVVGQSSAAALLPSMLAVVPLLRRLAAATVCPSPSELRALIAQECL